MKTDNNFKKFSLSLAVANGGGFVLIQATLATYLTIFLTDQVAIPAGIAGIVLFIGSIIDAVKDPFVGAVIDRTNTRIGRYRPYFITAPFIYCIVSVLLFSSNEHMSLGVKIAYTLIFYVLWATAFSFCNTSSFAALPAETLDTQKRNKTIMLYTTLMSVGYTIASSFTTNFVEWVGGYVPLMIIYSVLTIPPFFIMFASAKEKYILPVRKSSMKDDLKLVLKHKELYPVYLVWCLANISYGVMFSASTYYIIYYIGRPDIISGYMLAVSLGALVSMSFLFPIAMRIFKSPQRCLIATQAITVVCYVILLFAGKNLILLFVLSFIAASVCSMQHGLLGIINNDLIDYIQLKDGIALNGTISSIKGFSQKFGSAFVNAVILGTLAVFGYVAGAIGGQPQETLIAINCLRFIVPAIASGLVVILMIRYPITKYYGDIRKMKEGIESGSN